MLHEDEGAERLRRITQNENMHPSVVKKAKLNCLRMSTDYSRWMSNDYMM